MWAERPLLPQLPGLQPWRCRDVRGAVTEPQLHCPRRRWHVSVNDLVDMRFGRLSAAYEMTTRRLSYVVLLTWLSGCGGSASSTSDRDGGPTGGGGSSTDGAGGSSSGGTGVVDRRLPHRRQLPDGVRGRALRPDVACQVYTSMAACEAAMWFAESPQVLSQVAGVHSGKVRFDATAAAACLAALPNDCFVPQDKVGTLFLALDVFNSIESCFQAFTGLLPPGSPCGIPFECAYPAYCGLAFSLMSCAPGTCAYVDGGVLTFPTLGQACSSSCAPPAICRSGTCVMLAGEGEPCSPGGCGRLDDFCPSNQTGSAVCQRRLADGGACGDRLTLPWASAVMTLVSSRMAATDRARR